MASILVFMGLFSSDDTEYRVDDDSATSLQIRAVLFDLVTFIFAAAGLGLFAVGLAKSAGFAAAGAAASAIPYVGTVASKIILGARISSSFELFVAGLGLSVFSSFMGAAFWFGLMSSFRSRGVKTFWGRLAVLFIKALPFPGLNALPFPWFFMFTYSAIQRSRREDREKSGKNIF